MECDKSEPKLPQKKFYRQRAHANPISDHDLVYPITPKQVNWSDYFENFTKESRVEFVDIGCGYGGLLVRLAELFPEKFSIGFEIRVKVSDFVVDRIKALRAVANENEEQLIKYTNINCIRTNAMKYLPNYFCKSQLSKIFFLYPDPHFKKCKFKWRIISPMLIAEYAFVLRAGGMVYTLTDVKELSEWIVKHFNASKLFREIVIDDEAIRSDLIIELLLTDDPSEEGKKVSRTGGCKWLRCFERLHDDGT